MPQIACAAATGSPLIAPCPTRVSRDAPALSSLGCWVNTGRRTAPFRGCLGQLDRVPRPA